MAFDLALDLPAPSGGRTQALRRGQLGIDAELAAIRPWMACGGVPPEQCRSEGTPSLGEAPDAGAGGLWLLWVGRHSGSPK
ncbi:hypothetical protein FEF10_10200 [Pseudomonas protegens]|uniref:Uncharacterized protein n=1 Tax=Pseudomonas protegens TaxID=380021 RepID=A0ABY2VFU0_9PSED|nr:hypothetical protein FEF10_10200 [Pseudomonas protegens]